MIITGRRPTGCDGALLVVVAAARRREVGPLFPSNLDEKPSISEPAGRASKPPTNLARHGPCRTGSGGVVREVLRRIHQITSWLFAAGVLLQGYLAGAAMTQFGGTGDFETHVGLGYTLMGSLALLVLIFSLLGRFPRRQIGLTVLLLLLYLVQTSLPLARESWPLIAALHPVNAMGLFVLARVIGIRARPNPASVVAS